ncbi:hypothetical protein SAMN04488142_2192 [Halomonas sp. hl-4]|nr:hypothetical protein SAMN04488142_2192 [Halomonas sp. hl-4]
MLVLDIEKKDSLIVTSFHDHEKSYGLDMDQAAAICLVFLSRKRAILKR